MGVNEFELFMGCLGNGITVCNKAVMEHGDYKVIAHISLDGSLTWYVKGDYTPPDAREIIETEAQQMKAQYLKWWNSLSKEEQYARELDAMSLKELTEFLSHHRR